MRELSAQKEIQGKRVAVFARSRMSSRRPGLIAQPMMRLPSAILVLCWLVLVPCVHPDPIVRHRPVGAADRRLGQTAWVGPRSVGTRLATTGFCTAPAIFRALGGHGGEMSLPRNRAASIRMAAPSPAGDDLAGRQQLTRTLDWVNKKTRGGATALDFDAIFERSKNRINMFLESGGEQQGRARAELRKTIELSRVLELASGKDAGHVREFNDIVERSTRRLDMYLNGEGSSQDEQAQAIDDINRALDQLSNSSRLNRQAAVRVCASSQPKIAAHMPSPHATILSRAHMHTISRTGTQVLSGQLAARAPLNDFDVILRRSRNRMNVEAQRCDLRSKRETLAHMEKGLKASLAEVQAYANEYVLIDAALSEARTLGAPRGRIQELEDQVRASQMHLRGMERAVMLLEEQTTGFVSELKKMDAQLEADRIRNELVSERERQLVKLQKLLLAADENAEDGVQDHLSFIRNVDTNSIEHERADAKFQDFLWQRVGLSKNKAAIAAAVMPNFAEGVVVDELEATVRWLEEHVFLGGGGLVSAVATRPSILVLDIQVHLEPVVSFLTETVGLDKRGVAAVVAKNPEVLEADVKQELQPRFRSLRSETGVAVAKAAKLVQMHPESLGSDGLASLQPYTDFFREEVGMSRTGMGKIFGALPGLTCLSLKGQLRPTHAWLLSIGVPPARVERMLVAHPKTMGYSLEKKLKPIVAYLWDEIGVRDADKIGKIVSSFPQILGLSLSRNLKPTVAFFVEEAGVPAENLPKIFSTFPQLFGLSLDKTIRPRTEFLVKEVGVPGEKLAKVISSFPNLLAYDHVGNLRPTVSYLHDNVGIPTESMGKIVAAHPQILGYSVEDKLLPTVEYLVKELGVPEHSVCLVVERCPKLLGCSVDRNLRPTVRFLTDEVGMSLDEVAQIVVRYPALMGLSVDNNLRPKLAYLVEEVKIDRSIIRQHLKTCPQLLAYSLEQRIKPRHRVILARGLKLGLHSMLSPTDISFYQRYGGGLGRVATLTSEVKPVRVGPSTSSSSSPIYYWHGKEAQDAAKKNMVRLAKGAAGNKAALNKRSMKKKVTKSVKKSAPRPATKRNALVEQDVSTLEKV